MIELVVEHLALGRLLKQVKPESGPRISGYRPRSCHQRQSSRIPSGRHQKLDVDDYEGIRILSSKLDIASSQ